MKQNSLIRLSLIILGVITSFTIQAQGLKTYTNLNAGGETVYFSFEGEKPVKASDNWDLSFNKTTVGVNSASAAQVVDGEFTKLTVAPKDGYKNDSDKGNAIPSGSGNGWYKYNMMGHTITPLPNKVIFVKTKSGKHIKLEILSYYKDKSEDKETGYYSFQYTILD